MCRPWRGGEPDSPSQWVWGEASSLHPNIPSGAVVWAVCPWGCALKPANANFKLCSLLSEGKFQDIGAVPHIRSQNIFHILGKIWKNTHERKRERGERKKEVRKRKGGRGMEGGEKEGRKEWWEGEEGSVGEVQRSFSWAVSPLKPPVTYYCFWST